MKKATEAPIKVSLYGVNPRSYKAMTLYLKGPCSGIAEVVEEHEAEAYIIDADFPTAAEILQNRQQQDPPRPIILLSLENLKIANTFFVKKPVNAEQLIAVMQQIQKKIKPVAEIEKLAETVRPSEVKTIATNIHSRQSIKASADTSSIKQSRKNHEVAVVSFLGYTTGIDFKDITQIHTASFDPRDFFLGYVQSAFKVARHEVRTLQLNSFWKPIVIIPETGEIWLDADDKQLRVVSVMEHKKVFGNAMGLTSVISAPVKDDNTRSHFQDMNAFLWKLTIWTSRGRFPVGLDLEKPIYLKHWPNFTRLVVTPAALRIASLMVKGSRTPLEIIKILKIDPQCLFVFISACQATGLLGISERHVDTLLVKEEPKPSRKQSLLSKILNKLRGE